MSNPKIRPIRVEDNASMAEVIRIVMPEFGAGCEGFAMKDAEVDDLYAAYSGDRADYFVVENEDRIVGGAGYAALEGGDSLTCELRKMYFLPEARGLGLGEKMLKMILAEARRAQFHDCYIETLTGMDAAKKLYRKFGFQDLERPLGETGHFGCDTWMSRSL